MAYSTVSYDEMIYRRVGDSGLLLPAISLGLWHNFGKNDEYHTQKEIICGAFERGICHFDLANNYGPPAGQAEENFGKIFQEELKRHRDEMIISSKAGYHMWEGPYGEWGSKKHIYASCNQSLKRLGLDYVDIFYHHRPDPNTPLEETAHALDLLVKQGKALYIGISNYSPVQTEKISNIFKKLGTPFIIHQVRYNMIDSKAKKELFPVLKEHGLGAVAFSPLAQGLLTNRYLNGIPSDSRASRTDSKFLSKEDVNVRLSLIQNLTEVAKKRNQSLAQMALAWILNEESVASVIVGISRLAQLDDNIESLKNLTFSQEELTSITKIINNN